MGLADRAHRHQRRLPRRTDAARAAAPRGDVIGTVAAVVVMIILAVVTLTTTRTLVSTMGIVAVAAGLFLRPFTVLIIGVLAVFIAQLTVLVDDTTEGEYRVLNVLVGALLGVAVAITRDRRLRTIERMRDQDAELLGSVADGIVGVDVRGDVTFLNDAAQRLLGVTEDASVGQPVHDLTKHAVTEGTPCPGGRDCTLLVSEAHDRSSVFLRSDGTQVDVELATRDVTRDGFGDRGAVLSFRDIGERLAGEQQRAELIRVQASEAEHRRVLAVLERAIQPPLPIVPGLALDMTHRPADERAPTGGDLYDAHVLRDGRLLLIVTDVAGKGVEATRNALRVVNTARTLMASAPDVSTLIKSIDAALQGPDDEVVATVAAVTVDPVSGAISAACAGHPPPLVVRHDGTTDYLDSTGRPIGYPDPGTDVVVTDQLAPGDLLVVYTDGLVEGGANILEGLETLEHHARLMRDRPIEGWCDRLASHVLHDAVRRDDLLVLCIRRLG